MPNPTFRVHFEILARSLTPEICDCTLEHPSKHNFEMFGKVIDPKKLQVYETLVNRLLRRMGSSTSEWR